MIAADFDPELFDETRARRYRALATTIADPNKAAHFASVAARLEARLSDYQAWKKEHSQQVVPAGCVIQVSRVVR